MAVDDFAWLPAVELAAAIRTRKISPVELTRAMLQRIEKHNPALNAFVTVSAEEALCSAEKAEAAVMRGEKLGPLHGVPLHVKDNLYVADMTGRVQKFSPDGRFLLCWQMPQTDLGKPKGMAYSGLAELS